MNTLTPEEEDKQREIVQSILKESKFSTHKEFMNEFERWSNKHIDRLVSILMSTQDMCSEAQRVAIDRGQQLMEALEKLERYEKASLDRSINEREHFLINDFRCPDCDMKMDARDFKCLCQHSWSKYYKG